MMSVFFKKAVSIVLICALLLVSTPQEVPSFSIGEEREVGEKLLYAVRSTFPIIGDPDIHQYINSLGAEVLEVAGFQFFDYRFYIVKSDQFNAFAAPSGLIFFYTKLIESMDSEDELVSVLAHEIGHVAKRHLASRIEKGKIINIASLGLALASIAFGGGGAATQALLTGSLAAGQSAQLHFSREDEIEADLLAYKWINDLGRDPHGQKQMLRTMRRITRYRMGQMPQYLLTHPNPEARLEYVESLLTAEGREEINNKESEDFSFLRFKYRLMSMSRDNRVPMRAYLVNIMSDARSSPFQMMMARYGLSQLDRQENNPDRALIHLEKVIESFPAHTVLIVDRAIILAQQGNIDSAIADLESALKKDPNNMYAAFHLAQLLHKKGDNDRSLELFYDVAYNMPEFSDVYFQIGKLLSQRNDQLHSRFYLGKYYLYEGKLKLAAANFKQVAETETMDPEVRKQSRENLLLIERLQK